MVGEGVMVLRDLSALGGVHWGIPCNVGKNQVGRKEKQALTMGWPVWDHIVTDMSLRILNSNLAFQDVVPIKTG